MILVLDFGSQYTQLIARRIRESKVYCEIHPFNISLEKIDALKPEGIILSGGPASVYHENAPKVKARAFQFAGSVSRDLLRHGYDQPRLLAAKSPGPNSASMVLRN